MLYLYYSNQLEQLAENLAAVHAASAPADPLSPELVLVQNQGMAQWLTQRLARAQGISANIEFLLPAQFGWRLYQRLQPELGERSCFDKDVLVWRIMQTLPECLTEPEFTALARYLGEDAGDQRRYQLAQRICDVFDQYLIYRPEWLLAWEQGELQELGPDEAWQAALWRRLAAVEEPHRAKLWRQFMECDDLEPVLAALPERLTVFGISSLPPVYLDLLRRVAERREVHFFWLNPCQEYWADLVSARTRDRLESLWRRQGRSAAPVPLEEGNVLLASLGKVGRDAFSLHWNRLLDGGLADDEARFIEPDSAQVLGRVQHDILTLAQRDAGGRMALAPSDDSLSIHACHSPMREVQVLYEHLLERFNKDPSLSPSQILVMAPDIESYVPYIHAVFGVVDAPARHIPYTIADLAPQAESEVVRGFLTLLECERGRFTAPEMFDLLQSEPVRARFGIGADELPLIEHWLRETGIRWGLDADDRERLNLPRSQEGSWSAGLERLLLGYALPLKEQALLAGRLPFDHIEGGDAETAGKLLAFHERLCGLAELLRSKQTVVDWCDALGRLLDAFFSAGKDDADLFLVRSALTELKSHAEGFEQKIPAGIIRQHLEGALTLRSRSGGFLAGAVTFAGMVPMRALPFRVVALLGLNDNDFPRRRQAPGFDLMAHTPAKPGDRVHRDEDRYLFLESLLSAREHLYLSYVGRSARDNTEQQPSVILSELIDYLVDGFEVAGIDEPDPEKRRDELLKHWVRQYPLQPFSPRAFDGKGRFHSHSERYLAVARGLLEEREREAPFFEGVLPEPGPEWLSLDLEALVGFFRNPARYLLKARLGVSLWEQKELLDREMFGLDALQRSILRSTLLKEQRDGLSLAERLEIHKARCVLPAGPVGKFTYQKLVTECEGFAERVAALNAEPAPELSLDVELEHEGRQFRLTGQVDGITSAGRVAFRYAGMNGKDWMDFWIRHLAFQLCRGEDQPGESHWFDSKQHYQLAALPAGEARVRLTELLGLYWQGLREPLPLYPATSMAYVEALPAEDALEKARSKGWEAEYSADGDDPSVRLAFRGQDPLDARFRVIAEQVFRPVLDAQAGAAANDEEAS